MGVERVNLAEPLAGQGIAHIAVPGGDGLTLLASLQVSEVPYQFVDGAYFRGTVDSLSLQRDGYAPNVLFQRGTKKEC